jgi:hypothetical protein
MGRDPEGHRDAKKPETDRDRRAGSFPEAGKLLTRLH